MEDIYRFEFTSEELNRLVVALIISKNDDEQYLRNYAGYLDHDVEKTCARNILQCEALLDKLRRDYK